MPVVSTILTVAALLTVGALLAGAYVLLLRRSGAGGSPDRTVASGPRLLSLRAVIDRLASVGEEESVLLDRHGGRFVTLAGSLV